MCGGVDSFSGLQTPGLERLDCTAAGAQQLRDCRDSRRHVREWYVECGYSVIVAVSHSLVVGRRAGTGVPQFPIPEADLHLLGYPPAARCGRCRSVIGAPGENALCTSER